MNRKQRREYAKRINTPQKLERYSKIFDKKIREEYQKSYEEKYKEEIQTSIDHFIIAIVYALHFNEKTKFGRERIKDFMNDLLATVDMFRTGEYKPEEYVEILHKENIDIVGLKEKGGENK